MSITLEGEHEDEVNEGEFREHEERRAHLYGRI